MKVWVNTPVIDGDRVFFSWRQSGPNPFQRANELSFRYEGIDLRGFSTYVFYEVFLSLQLRIFVSAQEPVELIFPEPIPARAVEFWRAFHGANEVEIGPIIDIESYEPRIGSARHETRKVAIFYGGGKDSMLATGMLTELFGDDQVVLIQYVAPVNPAAGTLAMHERRQERHMLAPIRKLRGVATQRVFTDYVSNLNEEGLKHRPHRQLYTAGALPAMLAWGTEYSSFGDTRTDFAILEDRDGRRNYKYSGSRPEIIGPQSTYYQRALRFDHKLSNVNFAFSTTQDHVLLIERYPELLPATVPCTNGNSSERFCHRCYKCMFWAVTGLSAGFVDPNIDYDRILTENQWTQRIVDHAKTGVELTYYGNAEWVEGLLKVPIIYQPICHVFSKIDPDLLNGRIGYQARTNLYIMMALLGNTHFPNQEVVAQEIFDFVGGDLMPRIAKLASEHQPMVDKLPAPWIYSNREAIIDYTTRMPTRLDALSFLRD
ncbi:hypothetical protein BH09CHL1_BH09CHL1_06120 [soil metagenome]